jgi:hypothetical protein
MKRQIWILNIALVVASAGLAWKLKADWQAAARRYGQLAPEKTAASSAPPAAAVAPAAGLEIIAQGNLFSPDRNNRLPEPDRTPPPPDPILVGIANLGSRRVALLAESPGQPDALPRQVGENESFSEFKVVAIRDHHVEVEFQGKRKRLEVMATPRQVAAPAARTSGPTVVTSGASGVVSVAPTAPSADAVPPLDRPNSTGLPDVRTSADMFGRSGTDNYPEGTVIQGWRKVTRATPFGKQVWWERVKQ